MLVQKSAQACLKDPEESLSPSALPLPSTNGMNDLVSKTSALNLANTTASSSPPSRFAAGYDCQDPYTIQVRSTPNSLVESDRIIKLKTTNARSAANHDWKNTLAHAHLGSVAHVVLAVHEYGNFISVERRAVADREKEATDELQRKKAQEGKTMARLEMFINNLRDALIGHSGALEEGERPQYSLICRNREMALHRRTNNMYLLDEYADLFKA